MAQLTEAQKEAIYDAQRDGSAYIRPEPDPAPSLPADMKAWIDRNLAKEQAAQPSASDQVWQFIDDVYAEQFAAGYAAGERIAAVLDDEVALTALLQDIEAHYRKS